MIKEQKAQLKSVKKLINSLAEQMQAVIDSCEQLKKSYRKITQVIGVGPLTAIKCISETDNFTRFINARKFSCHCGLAPFPYQSGSSIKGRTRTHYLKNASLKGILFKAATSAIQHDPQLRNYYNRKLDEGKHKLSVLNAIANKIVLRIFAVVNRDEPFIKLNA
jgi:transposase